MKGNAFRSISFAAICMVLGVLIALQMKSVNLINLSQRNLDELQNKLLAYAAKNEDLSNRNAELIEYINILEGDMASGSAQIDSIIKEKERAAIFAGLREVSNYGILIQIRCAEGVEIRDSVLRQFLNELRAFGAQALAVNDERIVAMSEIRASGPAIIINGNPYNRQGLFEIKAITDPKKEKYLLSTLDALRKTIENDLQFSGDHYDIQYAPQAKLTIPALSEDSTAFKIDLLIPAQ